MSDAIPWDELRSSAEGARARAYAPYSQFHVGACLLAADGRRFAGCNVENASFGLCQCAERTAVGAAVVAGVREFTALAIMTPGPEPATPCGMCRQVLFEFAPHMPVRSFTPDGRVVAFTVAELLPGAFGPDHLRR